MSVQIPLTQGLTATIDKADLTRVLAAGKWHAKRDRVGFYAARNIRREDGTRGTLRLHTFLTGWPLVDHVNGDGLDNRHSNLRPATDAQNRQNRRRQANNSSGYKGVDWFKRQGRWRARIKAAGTWYFLGYHDNAEEAARAYDAAALELHGEFARLNFP